VSGAPPPDIGAKRIQLGQLTGMRGLAAWFVVLYHARASLTAILPGEIIAVLAKGYLAVDLFFMLSGFVMWLSYCERFREGGWSETGTFLWKRLARIWPLHALILAGFVVFGIALHLTGREAQHYPFAELPLHIALVHNWGLTDGLAWNDPSWSISAEMGAYLLFPLLVLGVRWERIGIAGLLAVGGLIVLALHAWFAHQGHRLLDDAIARTGLVRCLAQFTLGMVLSQIWLRVRGNPSARLAAFVALAGFAGLAILLPLPETLVAPAIIAALLLALALDTGALARCLASRPLSALGDWSYATYLSHFGLFILFKIAFVEADLQVGWAGLAAYVLSVLAASAILFTRVEKPAQNWLNGRRPARLRSARR
jgi:peptidoglycan/LPS O-acetylase OafA/YrhL